MKLIRALWRWSLVVTLPVAVVFIYWVDRTAARTADFWLRYDIAPLTSGVFRIGVLEGQVLYNRIAQSLSPSNWFSQEDSPLRQVYLYVDESSLTKLDSNLPHSGFEEVRGYILNGDQMLECDLRYRGDFAHHWATHKKSWRVKTKRDELWDGMRKFNLIGPKGYSHLNNYLGYELAREMGLLAPRTEFVELYINGELSGVRLLVEQLDESTLRNGGYMPGDLYSGEMIARDTYRGVAGSPVFEHPEVWQKVAINNHYPEESTAALQELLSLVIQSPSEELADGLSQILDMDVWGRFSAYETVSQCFHFDETHNWRLYWDANRGKFIPVVWDPIALTTHWSPHAPGQTSLDVVSSRLHALLYRSGDFLRSRHRALADFFAEGTDQRYKGKMFDILNPLYEALQRDVMRRGGTISLIAQAALSLSYSLDFALEDVRREYLESQGGARFARIVDGVALELDGRRPIWSLRVSFDEDLQRLPQVQVRYAVDGRPVNKDVTGACTLVGSELSVDVSFLAQYLPTYRWNRTPLASQQHRAVPAYYELVFDDPGAEVIGLLADQGSGYEEVPEEAALESRDNRGMYQAIPEIPRLDSVVLSGTVVVSETREYTQNVRIEPGTVVLLEPGASVRFTGRVDAEGTADRPIRFEPADAEKDAWGAIALQGIGTQGSRFRYCEFEGGSGWKTPMFEYSGMVSVHDTVDVEFSECSFRDSRVVDDMVHGVYTQIGFYDCVFDNALMDALDLDISEALVVDCVFRDSGNDALDLMASKVVVHGTELVDSLDKGISVGEETTLLCTDIKISGCAIGIEGKDRSQAYVYNSLFDGNDLAINVYNKNWRYGDGGHVYVRKSRFANTRRSIVAAERSSIEVLDCFLDKMPTQPLDRVDFLLSDSMWKLSAKESDPHEFPAELAPVAPFAEPYFRQIEFARRGRTR